MNRKSGFTLVELLLALGVVAIGLATLFSLLPGISRFSREIRDKERMQGFAEDVFASLRWQIAAGASGSPTDPQEPLMLMTITGQQNLLADGTEQRWPSDPGADVLVPVFIYRLTLNTVSVHQVEALLEVRAERSSISHSFQDRIPIQEQAW